MRPRRRRQHLLLRRVVYVQAGLHERRAQRPDGERRDARAREPRGEDRLEDARQGCLLHLCKREHIKVTLQTLSDRVAAAARRAHRAHEVHVHQRLELAYRLPVVPAPEVHPLTHQLDWWLGTELHV